MGLQLSQPSQELRLPGRKLPPVHSRGGARATALATLTFDTVLALGQLADVQSVLQFIPEREREPSQRASGASSDLQTRSREEGR